MVWLGVISNLGLLRIPDYARHISAATLPSQMVQLLGSYRSGWGLGLILFGLYLVITGRLAVRSTYLPRWPGWLLFVYGWAWVADNLSV